MGKKVPEPGEKWGGADKIRAAQPKRAARRGEITGRKLRSVGSHPVQRLRGGGPAQVQLPDALAQGKDGGGGDRELVNAHA